MKPTSDERREVAWRLRSEVSEGECIDFAVFRIVHDVLGVDDATGARAGRILADLIDPTCHVVTSGEWRGKPIGSACSVCHARFTLRRRGQVACGIARSAGAGWWMMTSDKERRDIARRLRAAAKTKSHSTDYLWRRLEIAVNGWKFGDDIDDSYTFDNDVLARLADLIDPTCKVDSIEPVEYGEFNQAIGSAFHLTCGHTVMRALTGTPPAYCEECGARVVDDDNE